MPVAQYVQHLESIETMLSANDLASAQTEARALLGASVTWSRGTFRADDSLLDDVIAAGRSEGPHRARLATTIAELRRASGMENASGDRALLRRIAAEQEVPELQRGGEVPTKLQRDVPLIERIATSISDMLRWIRDKLAKILEWLFDLLPRSQPGESAASAGLRWIVFSIVAAIVLVVLVLAIGVLRRSRASSPATIETSTPLGSKADEDPLSRGAKEWERYAVELAKAGRFREAIRAWYHAVLVTCYAAGILHFRKGRTNWEYLASLSPSIAWRPEMIELTRRFEREWYGSMQSTADALESCAERAERILNELRGAA